MSKTRVNSTITTLSLVRCLVMFLLLTLKKFYSLFHSLGSYFRPLNAKNELKRNLDTLFF